MTYERHSSIIWSRCGPVRFHVFSNWKLGLYTLCIRYVGGIGLNALNGLNIPPTSLYSYPSRNSPVPLWTGWRDKKSSGIWEWPGPESNGGLLHDALWLASWKQMGAVPPPGLILPWAYPEIIDSLWAVGSKRSNVAKKPQRRDLHVHLKIPPPILRLGRRKNGTKHVKFERALLHVHGDLNMQSRCGPFHLQVFSLSKLKLHSVDNFLEVGYKLKNHLSRAGLLNLKQGYSGSSNEIWAGFFHTLVRLPGKWKFRPVDR
jgi:hypothetical protein